MADGIDPKEIAARVARKRAGTPKQQQAVEDRLAQLAQRPPVELPPLGKNEMPIPDVAEAVEGWRAWGVLPKLPPDRVPLLHSVTYGRFIWKPREVQTATCKGNRHKEEGVPGKHCSCGNYSAKTYDHLISMSYHVYDAENRGMFHVIGEVANWGRVVEGTQGWRAEHSYPRTLYVPFEAWHLAGPLQAAYGVEVKLKNFLGYSVVGDRPSGRKRAR